MASDDAVALAIALSEPEVEVVAITTVAVFSANICDRHHGLTFFEDFDDLALAIPVPFHIRLLFSPVLSTNRWYYFMGAFPYDKKTNLL
jgi:hypothetical protein